jgi:hypothetical protein
MALGRHVTSSRPRAASRRPRPVAFASGFTAPTISRLTVPLLCFRLLFSIHSKCFFLVVIFQWVTEIV